MFLFIILFWALLWCIPTALVATGTIFFGVLWPLTGLYLFVIWLMNKMHLFIFKKELP